MGEGVRIINWLKDVIGAEKAIIAMCHLRAMPEDPYYDTEKGMGWVVGKAKEDLYALRDGGVDAVIFSDEFSPSYLTRVETEVVAAMARMVGELKPFIKAPFGVSVLWDPIASLDLAIVTGALLMREIVSGIYASDFGLWNTSTGETARHQDRLDTKNVKLLYNIVPGAIECLADRDIRMVAKTTMSNCRPDAICVSGATTGSATDVHVLSDVKSVLPNTVVIVNTGCREDMIEGILKIADTTVAGTTFEYNGEFENQVDVERVKEFTEVMGMARAS